MKSTYKYLNDMSKNKRLEIHVILHSCVFSSSLHFLTDLYASNLMELSYNSTQP